MTVAENIRMGLRPMKSEEATRTYPVRMGKKVEMLANHMTHSAVSELIWTSRGLDTFRSETIVILLRKQAVRIITGESLSDVECADGSQHPLNCQYKKIDGFSRYVSGLTNFLYGVHSEMKKQTRTTSDDINSMKKCMMYSQTVSSALSL